MMCKSILGSLFYSFEHFVWPCTNTTVFVTIILWKFLESVLASPLHLQKCLSPFSSIYMFWIILKLYVTAQMYTHTYSLKIFWGFETYKNVYTHILTQKSFEGLIVVTLMLLRYWMFQSINHGLYLCLWSLVIFNIIW